MGSTAARAFFGLGLLAIAGHLILSSDVALGNAVALASAGAILIGAACHRPAAWRAWVLIGCSQLAAALDVALAGSGSAAGPGPSDGLHIAADLLLVAGVAALAVLSGRRQRPVANLDALLVTFSLAIAAWAVVFELPHGGSLYDRAVAVAHPVGDVLLLGALVRLLLAQGRRTVSYWLLAAAVAAAGTIACGPLLGAAALHPSMRRLLRSRPRNVDDPMSLRRLLVVGAALVMAPVAILVAALMHREVNVVAACAMGSALLVLVVLRFVAIVRELDRLRVRAQESERRLRMIFDRAPIGISVGRDGIMSETNPALHRMLGYTGAELATTHFLDVTHPDDRHLGVQAELDEGTRDAFSVDKRYVRKDGSVVAMRVHIALDVEDGLGVSLMEDVTDRRALTAQLAQAQKMEAIGKLAGGIAHDFNNLMTAVIGYSDLLLRASPDGDPRREKVEAIRGAAVRASDLTRQLLAFGRRQLLQADELDLRDVVVSMEGLVRHLCGEQIRVETLLAAGPVLVRADQAQLEQVLLNLAANARDAMPGGGTITIAVGVEGETAVLTVADDGVGMDEETRARVFEPFFTTKPLAETSGLGLSTVHGIVGQSGGTIEVESRPGAGAVFEVRLPLVGARLPERTAAATLVD